MERHSASRSNRTQIHTTSSTRQCRLTHEHYVDTSAYATDITSIHERNHRSRSYSHGTRSNDGSQPGTPVTIECLQQFDPPEHLRELWEELDTAVTLRYERLCAIAHIRGLLASDSNDRDSNDKVQTGFQPNPTPQQQDEFKTRDKYNFSKWKAGSGRHKDWKIYPIKKHDTRRQQSRASGERGHLNRNFEQRCHTSGSKWVTMLEGYCALRGTRQAKSVQKRLEPRVHKKHEFNEVTRKDCESLGIDPNKPSDT